MAYKYKQISLFILLFICFNSFKEQKTDRFWSANTLLKYSDFKSTKKVLKENAYIHTGILSDYLIKNNLFLFYSKSYMNNSKSYMHINYRDSITLLHEQCHFDINELHRRKMMKFCNEKFTHSIYHFKYIIYYIDSLGNVNIDNFDKDLDDSTFKNHTYEVQKYFFSMIRDSIEKFNRYSYNIDTFNCIR